MGVTAEAHAPNVRQTPGVTEFSLEHRYLLEDGQVYLSGLQALVRMLMDRARHDRRLGLNTSTLVSGYEGSPLAGYDLEIARRRKLLTEFGVVHQPAVNEELGATAVAGSQLAGEVATLTTDGITGVWYGKAPGLDRASDAVRHANLIGTSSTGGVVALIGDDPSAKSSTFPCSSESAIADLQLPALYPADSHEVLEFGLHAVEMSRASGLWSAMKIATNIADGAGVATVSPTWTPPDLDGLAAYAHHPNGRLIGADLAALERSFHEVRMPIALEYLRRSGVNRIHGAAGDARIGVVAAGKTYLDVRQALGALGLDDTALERYGIRLLKLGAIWPLEPAIVREFAEGLDEIIIVEDKRSFLEAAVKDALYGRAGAPAVHGKRDPEGKRLFTESGELDPDQVTAGLVRRLRTYGDIEPVERWQSKRRQERINLPLLAQRTPYFCSGCPHNSSTKVPDGSIVGAGIGCHGMVMVMPEKQVGTVVGVTQMGGEGAQWIGMAPFVETPHFLQNIGDGTFAHSGSLAVRAAAAAGVNITYKLLLNSAVAMTGGQDAVGAMSVERIAALLMLEGAKRVVITSEDTRRIHKALRKLPGGRPSGVSVRHRDEIVTVQEELAAVPGVTVLVHDQECAAEKRRKRKRGKAETPAQRVVINERICEGCGDCGEKSNCLSVQPVDTPFGRKTRIHQSSCNLDFSCLEGDCPSFVTVVPASTSKSALGEDGAEPPEPEVRFDGDSFAMRVIGVGGTGVVTIAQILATAAFLDGRQVRSLDQTGLAQKGGAVVSDIKFGSGSADLAAKLAAGECDLYLGCDSLAAADADRLAVTDPARTVAVISTAEVPTGHMVVDTGAAFPDLASLRDAVDERVTEARYVAADELASAVLDDEQYANMVLVGAAYQRGALPISLDSIQRAIELNGVAVEQNLRAFKLGRTAVLTDNGGVTAGPGNPAEPTVPGRVDPRAAERARALVQAEGELGRLVDVRIPELVAYQSGGHAEEYARFVEQVRVEEQRRVPGSTAVTEAVARQLFKLMTYKDEYEVARLSLDPAFRASVTDRFGAGSRVAVQLHPPILRAMGLKRKIAFGGWSRPVFHLLYALRRLRGTPLDLFGYAALRKTERSLVREYRDTIVAALESLTPASASQVTELADLPDGVRGYEEIKERNVAAYREATAQALTRLQGAVDAPAA